MKRTFLDIVLVTIWCCLTPFCQLLGQIEKVDPEIRQLYEHYTGNSLEQVINNLDKSQQSSLNLNGNVVVRFNGGRPDQNKLFIGQKNTLEILVTNDAFLGGMTLPFRFGCTAGSFSFVEEYGTSPTTGSGPLRVVKLHSEAFDNYEPWALQSTTSSFNSDTILIGGFSYDPGIKDLPSHTSPVLLYSLQIEISANSIPTEDGFWIDNVIWTLGPPYFTPIPWQFAEATGGNYSPSFQGQANQSLENPSAPRVFFDVVEPPCYSPSPSPAIKPLPIVSEFQALSVEQLENHYSVYVLSTGERGLSVMIDYVGDIADLATLGVTMTKPRRAKGSVAAAFPLRMLPDIARHPNIERIYSGEQLEQKLNFTTFMANGNFRQIRPNYGVSGEGVIIGIIDTGLDWLHEDFRKVDGTTRVSFFWDQTDSCGNPPSGYSLGCEWSESEINQKILTLPSPPGPDTIGHGTHVTSIASGNGLSRSDTLYAGIAPQADLIIVRSNLSQTNILFAMNYIANLAAQADKPWVVNCSFGSTYRNPTSRDGNSRVEQEIDDIYEDTDYGDGRIFVVSSGNMGDKKLHARGIGPDEVYLDIGVDSQSWSAKDSIDICILYPNSASDVSVTLVAPPYDLNSTYGPIQMGCITGPYAGWIAEFDSESTDGIVRIFNNRFLDSVLADPVASHPNDRIARIQVQDWVPGWPLLPLPMRDGVWKIRLDGTNLGNWDAYIIYADSSSFHQKRFTPASASTAYTIASPATAHHCIAVGSTNTNRVSWIDFHGLPRYVDHYGNESGDISQFTSLGPTRDERNKPEIFAPGYSVMAARASNITDTSSTGYTGYMQGRYIAEGGNYLIMSGTSMAAPHVTGAIALALQRDPTLSLSSLVDKLSQSSAGGTIDVTQFLGLISSGVANEDSVASGQHSDDIILPGEFTLAQNHPNPFNNDTIIEFYLPGAVKSQDGLNLVRVEVFNVLGQLVRVLFEGICTPGTHRIAWDGKADNGANVASGVYLYRASTTSQVVSRKMVILK